MSMKRFAVLGVVCMFIGGCSGRIPENMGVDDGGNFVRCPDSPNCVSSTEPGSSKYIAPILYSTDRQTARSVLQEVLAEQGGATLKTETEVYIHAEFRSALFGFVDDVEFYFPEEVQHIAIRSASRLGYWDLGANRRRMEQLRENFSSRINRH